MRADPVLAKMMLLKRGMRLSVQPVTEREFVEIVKLTKKPPAKPKQPAKKPRKR